tara:strand:- start:1077 stop:2120 length:1044 start_codon:yes stop_codon:yes gene_type:complete
MAYTTINNGSLFMNPILYTGNAGTQSITNLGFQPDLTWIKSRSATTDHSLSDSASGTDIQLGVNDANAADAFTTAITAFDSDGFSLGSNGNTNASAATFVGWNWKGGTTSGIATNGSTTITPSAYSFNQTSGVSILKFTGNEVSGAKLAHGLGKKPAMIICKSHLSGAWGVYNESLGATYAMILNTTAAQDLDSSAWNDTEPDSVNITLGSSINTNKTGDMVCYAFANIQGFSQCGSYKGNGNIDGPFLNVGFKPAFVMFKETGNTSNWTMYDNKRIGFNQLNYVLVANDAAAEWDANADHYIDILSNGIKFRGTSPHLNRSGGNYIYMAFADAPLVGTNDVPACAR